VRSGAPLAVELLDVGDVALVAGDERHPLSPRAFPTVAALVSGMVYTSRDDTRGFPRTVRYTLEATGTPDVDAFRLDIDSPPPLVGLRFGDADVEHDEVLVVRGRDLSVRWRAASHGDQVSLWIDGHRELSPEVLCTFADDGTATVPGRLLQHHAGRELSIVVTRQRRQRKFLPPFARVAIDFDDAIRVRATVVAAPAERAE
jgi:hypothetical protein